MRLKLEGIYPAMLTPFTKNGVHVDYDRAAALATRLADQGVHGLFVAGTTGEGPLMTLDERKRLLEVVIEAVGKRINVLAHTGCFDTASTIALSRHAAEAGAVLAGVIAPGFFGYDDAALKQHYKAVAKAVEGFPVFLYNLPSCAKNALSPDLVIELAEQVDNIAGIKDSSEDMTVLSRILAGAPKDFTIINGVDAYSYQAYLAGAKGSVTSTANVFPELFLKIFANVRKGNLKRAWQVQTRLTQTCSVFRYGAMAGLYKEALRLRGFDPGYVRSPQREASSPEKRALARELGALGLV
ncbi:MAG: dihydrodipicolinate synthase family protein [Candidatus Hydrogenedentes bacterium]|nr:dihydrodipicolinate synthase family protein [Candidatus Hydrogenedentota bacterium]